MAECPNPACGGRALEQDGEDPGLERCPTCRYALRVALPVGGPLSVSCPRCRMPPTVSCRRRSRDAGPHDERLEAAPPEVLAREGELVLVRHGGSTAVARIVELGAARLRVSKWSAAGARWLEARDLPVADLRGVPGPDDARAAAARSAGAPC